MHTAENDSRGVASEGVLKREETSASGFGAKRAVQIFLSFWISSVGIGFALGACVSLVHFVRFRNVHSMDLAVATAIGSVAMLLGTAIAWNMALHSFPARAGDEFKYALGLCPSTAARIFMAALIGLGLFLLIGLPILRIFPLASGVTVNGLAAASSTPGWPRVSWAFYVVAVTPACEELIFRGILFAGLLRSSSVRVAAVVTTLLFVLLHFSGLIAYPAALISILALGAAAQWVRISSRALLPAIALHLIYNLASVVVVSLQP